MKSPLVIPAVVLSAASLAWTTWSLVDLLGTGAIGLTVAAGADIVWASVIAAEARGLRVAGRGWSVPAIGWAALAAVAGLLVWHGLDAHSLAMAVAGPLLPLGAKVVWMLALTDLRDPAALTDDENALLAKMERSLLFEEARHRVELRRREMLAERQLAEVDQDFGIELSRLDKRRELARRRPLELAALSPAEPRAHVLAEPAEPEGEREHLLHSFTQINTPEPTAHRPAQPTAQPFGFTAPLTAPTAQSAQRAQAVERVAELLAQHPGLTSKQITERLGVSPATAKRYLREARRPA
ncbi:winged helix-turn-helix transcriptional regulator [Streptomyces sp. NPDC060184]|uniref:winged helix-turn-helix transcriptional regulator n=1 Tax=Streptomyces sp. NPDC060184 TaxID=3347064 RepID=UPI003664DE8C